MRCGVRRSLSSGSGAPAGKNRAPIAAACSNAPGMLASAAALRAFHGRLEVSTRSVNWLRRNSSNRPPGPNRRAKSDGAMSRDAAAPNGKRSRVNALQVCASSASAASKLGLAPPRERINVPRPT